jgi:hypothetical protein
MYRFSRWREAILYAPDTKAVHSIVRDYMAAIPPNVVAVLPSVCHRAIMGEQPLDIHDVAITLLHAELSAETRPEIREMIHEVAQTLAAASTRLAAVHRGNG